MKKFLMIWLLSLLFLSPNFVWAWDDCVFGETDCVYPGECPRYIDTDANAICDHSEASPANRELPLVEELDEIITEDLISGQELKTKTVAEVAEIYGINSHEYAHALREYVDYAVEPDTYFQYLHDNYVVEPSVVKEIAVSLANGDTAAISEIIAVASEEQANQESVYNLVPLTLILLAVYLFTWLLAKFKKITLLLHRKFWNWLLLLTFLLSGLFGIFLVLRINYGFVLAWPFNLLEMHVETGIAMAVISIFHIAWHWQYYLLSLKKKS